MQKKANVGIGNPPEILKSEIIELNIANPAALKVEFLESNDNFRKIP